jgi:4-hydroxybenzoate polyprenyltransferase
MLRQVIALARSSHSGPTLVVTAVSVMLGISVGLEPWRLVLLGLAIFFDQVSVALSNDWIDVDRDRAVGRTDKPVASGEVGVRAVRNAAFVCAALALLFAFPLGLLGLVARLIGLAAGWAYNAGLKGTPFSVLAYIVGFGILPAFPTLARAQPALPEWWAVLAGALLGVAAHFANVLPDLDDDRRTGIRGLPHRLGLRPSIVVTWCTLALAAVAIAVGTGSGIAVGGAALSVVIAAVCLVVALRRGIGRWMFRLVIIAALLDVAMLVLAGARLAV